MPRCEPKTRTAKALQDYRDDHELTQAALAEILRIDVVTLSRYERSDSPVGIPWVARKIESLTGVAPPQTRAELSAQLAEWLLETGGHGASRAVVSEASEEEAPPTQGHPRRHRRGQGRA